MSGLPQHPVVVENRCRSGAPPKLLLVHASLLAATIAYAAVAGSLGVPRGTLVTATSVLILALTVWSLVSWRAVTRRLFDPYTCFFVSVALFNGGQAFLEVFGLNENGILGGQFRESTVLDALLLVALGLAGLHAGALAAQRFPSRARVRCARDASQPRDLLLVGWTLLAISAVPAASLAVDAVSVVASGGYFALYQQKQPFGIEATANILGSFLVPSALFLCAGSGGKRVPTTVSAVVVLSYSAIYFFLGNRGTALLPLIAYAWLRDVCVRPIPRAPLLAAGALVVFVVCPLVGALRDRTGTDRLSADTFVEAFTTMKNPGSAALSEMGGSLATVAYTVELVPAERPFDCGESFAYAALTVLPSIFWDVHPSVAHGRPSEWLMWVVDPFMAERGGALDYSCVAEAYLNGGWVFSPIILGCVGLFVSGILRWAGEDRSRIAAVACYASFLPWFARSEAQRIVRPLFWYALLPYLAALAVTWVRRSRRAPAARECGSARTAVAVRAREEMRTE